MKTLITNKTFLISICFLLVVALAAGIFGMEYSSLLSKNRAIEKTLSETKADYDALSSQNAEKQEKLEKQEKTINDLNSKVNQLNDDISKIKLTKAKANSSKATTNTSSKKKSKVKIEKVNLKLLHQPNEGKKVCYLTFDDGPSDNTLKILDVLKEANAKATFFVIGTSKLSYIKRAKEEGHAIALHSNTHDYAKIYKSESAFKKDLDAIHDKVVAEIGEIPLIMRFPGGSSNTVSKKYKKGIMSKLVNSVEEWGYTYVDWNVDSTDASGNRVAPERIIKNIQTYSKNKGDICILMHDTSAKTTTVEALPSIICYLREKGYRFEALTKDSPIFHQGVNN